LKKTKTLRLSKMPLSGAPFNSKGQRSVFNWGALRALRFNITSKKEKWNSGNVPHYVPHYTPFLKSPILPFCHQKEVFKGQKQPVI